MLAGLASVEVNVTCRQAHWSLIIETCAIDSVERPDANGIGTENVDIYPSQALNARARVAGLHRSDILNLRLGKYLTFRLSQLTLRCVVSRIRLDPTRVRLRARLQPRVHGRTSILGTKFSIPQ
jgi:hypothetical protein